MRAAPLPVSLVVVAATLAVALSLALGAGCPSYSVVPDADREKLERDHQGQLLFFRHSMYVGQFYDDDRYRLVHDRRFEELTYLRTVEGDPIPPAAADGIIPAGTRVRVERLEWPTGEVVFRRPLYTPRYTTWVVLRVAADRGPEVTVEREQRHILLLPGGIVDGESFDLWFDAALSAEDPNPWLLSLPEEQQHAIALKRAVAGMDYDALTAALGFPDTITRDVVEGSTREVAVFGAVSVVLQDGVVARVSDPTPAG
ncbi:MAG: hypothetical protein HYS27_09565 [Deltaproteobacteria bacterium]|nr:hypothetical protein [Deltaproteobacteria bacterium]